MNEGGPIGPMGLFDALNSLVKPLVKLGLGGPCVVPAGLVVLETVGRRTGQRREVPVVALRLGDYLAVGSVRGGSQWLRNLDAQASTPVWLNGRRRQSYSQDLSNDAPTAGPRRLALAARRLFGAAYDGRVLRLATTDQAVRSVGETTTPLASA